MNVDMEKQALGGRVLALEGQVEELQGQLGAVEKRLDALADGQSIKTAKKTGDKLPNITSEEVLNWLDTSYLMPRVATTSFILVLAIALRTMTDGGTIDQQAGAFLGMIYAFALILFGWFSYSRQSIQAPVFTLWGTIVMCSVVVETHRVFEALPTEPAYFLLVVLGAATAIISRIYKVALPVFVGTLGMSIAGFAIDYPNPVFPYLVILLVTANLFTVYATRILRASWLRWGLLVLTIFMFQIWALKLTIYLGKVTPDELEFAITGFLPAIAVIGLLYLGIAFFGVTGKIQDRISRFDVVLPVINVFWIYLFCRYVLNHGLADEMAFGLVASVFAGGHLGLAWLVARRGDQASGSAAPFGLAGCILLALTLPMGIGNALISSTVLSAVAFGGARVAQQWKSGGIRYISYLMQIYAASALIFALKETEMSTPSIIGATASTLMAAIALWHYYWCCENRPLPEMKVFKSFDSNDRSVIVVLFAALLSGFFTLRVGIYQGLAMVGFRSPDAFSSGQSVLIICASALLMYLSVKKMNREFRTIGILLMLVGACKVFLIDIMSIKGLPLMISLFTFGTVAIFNQVMNRSWGKKKKRED